MTYNVPALEQLREKIELEASHGRHKQSLWAELGRRRIGPAPEFITSEYGTSMVVIECPTAACAAGWAVNNAGAAMLFSHDDYINRSGSIETSHCITKDKEVKSIQEYAAELLGISGHEGTRLFNGGNSTDEVLGMISELIQAGNHGVSWRSVRQSRLDAMEELGEEEEDDDSE